MPLAVAVSLRTHIPANYWLSHEDQLAEALDLIYEAAEKESRNGA